MNVLVYNISWMGFNLYLALLALFFCWSFLVVKGKVRYFFLFLWITYLPNTIYIITDVEHLIEQWNLVSVGGKLILLIQYSILEFIGLVIFLLAMYPIERLLVSFAKTHRRFSVLFALIGFNLLLGFIMVLGKFERVNSWDIFLNPLGVLTGMGTILTSGDFIILSLLLGLFTNFFYFLFRKPVYQQFVKHIKK